MRKILFRAKQKDNGEWIEGYYAFESNHACFKSELKYRHYIFKDIFMDWNLGGLEQYEVVPETVGQYTGLADKNCKRIFEGDILKIARVSDSIGSYYFPPLDYPVNIVVKWDMCAWMWETLCKDKRYIGFPDAWCHYECEVIGNIHDNPELLKGQINK